jgi:hypothetical protein
LSNSNQLEGIGITVALSLVAGYIVGKIVAVLGRRSVPYVDSEEFAE